MDYSKYVHLSREKRLEKYAKIFSESRQKLARCGLTFDNSAMICDFVLSLPDEELSNVRVYKGVYKRRGKYKYYSKIIKNGMYIYIGSFDSAYETALAYDKVCYKLYNDLDKLNFPELIRR